jgi:hypothetical protein
MVDSQYLQMQGKSPYFSGFHPSHRRQYINRSVLNDMILPAGGFSMTLFAVNGFWEPTLLEFCGVEVSVCSPFQREIASLSHDIVAGAGKTVLT